MITNIVAYLLLGGLLALVGLIAAVVYDMRRKGIEYADGSNDATPAPVTAPKKRGRPKGSKNKVRTGKTKKAVRSRA